MIIMQRCKPKNYMGRNPSSICIVVVHFYGLDAILVACTVGMYVTLPTAKSSSGLLAFALCCSVTTRLA
ncbi:hypothetical protein M426DRAFT_105202 [Hypoxylon sp. CI-4A]|nr:hypothetical protein M426DRAFT_105202 [Hypoxylon sp. CI-4A]